MQSLQALHRIAAIKARRRTTPHRRLKTYRERTDPFALDDDEFRRRYQFSKDTMRAVISLVESDLQLDRKGKGTSPKLQVLTAIRCWCRREVQEDAGGHHGLSQSTVSRICNRVARALASRSGEFIKITGSFAEEQSTMRNFMGMWNIPTVT